MSALRAGLGPVGSSYTEEGRPQNGRPQSTQGDSLYMRAYTAVVERCTDTGLFVAYVPGFRGAHSQGESLDELNKNLLEVIEMLLEDGEPL